MNQPLEHITKQLKVNRFLEENKHGYNDREIEYIRANWVHSLDKKFQVDILRQMYSELGFTDEENSIIVGVVDGRNPGHGTGARGDTEHRTDP